jgi:glucose/arabinose dehydrogenase
MKMKKTQENLLTLFSEKRKKKSRILLLVVLFALTACSASMPQVFSTLSLETPFSSPAAVNPSPSSTSMVVIETVQPTLTPPTRPIPRETTSINLPTLPATAFPEPSLFTWQVIAAGLREPVAIAHAKDSSSRLFIVEKAGRVRILQDGNLLEAPFLDILDRVGSLSSEQGLLGLDFHPFYKENGTFFVNYTDRQGNTTISRFRVMPGDPDRADSTSEERLLSIEQPYPNHNGGSVVFGPDNALYLGLGDGGAGGDPQENAENPGTLLGKILRINVDPASAYTIPPDNPFANGGGRPEIWALGLRNPWRFSFDRLTGDMWVADVGQNQWEEVNFLPAGARGGANFGWDFLEGTHSYENVPPSGLIPPIFEYDHSLGCSVIGGYVYRGKLLPEFSGIYLIGDYCTGNIWGLMRTGQDSWQAKLLFQVKGNLTSFGEDESGEVYLVTMSGEILKLSQRTP